MKWMIEETKLGDDQRSVIDEIDKVNGKPIWIQGHAGSGKSIVLLYALNDYVIRNPHTKVAVVLFTNALKDLIKTGIEQIPNLKGKNIKILTIYQLKFSLEQGNSYNAIFCDEVQDIPIDFIEKMKSISKQLVIAGDSAQSIYRTVPRFENPPATASQIEEKIEPLDKELTTIYRLTPSVISVLKNVYPELESNKTYNGKEDSEIRLFHSNTGNLDDETLFCWDECEMINRTRPNEINAILLYKKDNIVSFINRILRLKNLDEWVPTYVTEHEQEEYDFISLNAHLRTQELPLLFIGKGAGTLSEASASNKVVITTYHSSKGLDFDAVCLPEVHTDLSSTSNVNALILVALSRAKRDLLVTRTGNMYLGFEQFLKDLESKDMKSLSDSGDEIIF